MEGNGQASPYKLDLSANVREEIKQLLKVAKTKGLLDKANRALHIIFARLRDNPLGFGELFKELKAMKLLVHVATVPPFLVYFAIHQEARTVFIMNVWLQES